MQTETLETRINGWKWGIAVFAVILITAYFWYFGSHLGQPAAENADKWGQFGDFIGGLLNPLVAFAAFYWLTQSVKLQKTELEATRAELKKTALAQDQQAQATTQSVRIAAMTALLNSIHHELSSQALLLQNIEQKKPDNPEQLEKYNLKNCFSEVVSKQTIAELETRRRKYEGELIRLLEANNT